MKPRVDPRTGIALGGQKRAMPSHITKVGDPTLEDIPITEDLTVEEIISPPELIVLCEIPPQEEEEKSIPDKLENLPRRKRRRR